MLTPAALPDTAASPLAPPQAAQPDPEVRDRPARRRFSAAYKLRIVQEADAAKAAKCDRQPKS